MMRWRPFQVILAINIFIMMIGYMTALRQTTVVTPLGGSVASAGLQLSIALPLVNFILGIVLGIGFWANKSATDNERKRLGQIGSGFFISSGLILLISIPSCVGFMLLHGETKL